MTGAPRARDHLTTIAGTPRAAGSPPEAAARAYCARVLRDAGFDVREEPFEYSAFPGRYATACGGVVSTVVLVGAMLAVRAGRQGVAMAMLALGGLALAIAATWTVRAGVLATPWMRRRGANLTATRGTTRPSVWLVAHVDSKSQPIPMLVRAGAITLHGAAWIAAVALCLVDWLGGSTAGAWSAVAVVGVASGVPVMASVVGDKSPGAVDNASGVAAVLMAAVALPRDLPVGVLITSAEELGLAGARAWVRTRTPATALNCDGIDDAGEMLCMYSGSRPDRLVAAYERAARAAARSLRIRRLLPGVLVDGVAFSDAGWEALTLSRGTVGTLARIHTKRDSLDALTGAGIDDAVPVLMRVARELC